MRNKKVLLIGPIAPPYGGVSIHILRITNLLKNGLNLDFIDESRLPKKHYFNIRSLRFYEYFQRINKADVLYIHSGNNLLRIFHLFIGKIFSKKIILTLHGFTSKPPKFVFYVNGFIYRLANTIIVVNSELKERLLLPCKKCVIKEAFIPPTIKDEDELPGYINGLLFRKKKTGNSIICSNAFRLEVYNNQDLYGLDLCIEVARRLSERKVPFFFIFVVATTEKNADMYYKNEGLIKKLNLQENFLLINEKLSFVKLIEHSDIVLRATNTDGDSVTIREALFLNKLVLASDIVKRPLGVRLFQNRDINDLEIKLEDLIKTISVQSTSNAENLPDLNRELKKFYLNLIEKI